MEQLIIINEEDRTTTARELYEFLELNPSHYSKWVKRNIVDNQFAVENTDFILLALQGEYSGRGQKATDYKLSIDFAKKLCMVSKSARGEQARNYFIEVEKQYQQLTTVPEIPPMVSEYLALSEEDRAIAFFTKTKEVRQLTEHNTELTTANEEMKPKAEFYDVVANSENWLSMQDVANIINLKRYGRNNLFKFLVKNEILVDSRTPYRRFVEACYFKVIESPYEYYMKGNKEKKSGINTKVVVSQRGLDYIVKLLRKKEGLLLKHVA